MSFVWHYTIAEYLPLILEEQCLLPASSFVYPPEKPVLWFSRNQTWELTANKMVASQDGTLRTGNIEDTRHYGGGLVRFGLQIGRIILHPWPKIARKARMTDKTVQGLERTAFAVGANPFDWLGTTVPVPLAKIERIESEEEPGKWAASPWVKWEAKT